jgi:hypothetical protein
LRRSRNDHFAALHEAKLKPKVYGERLEAALSGMATVQHTITDEDRARVLAFIEARQIIRSAPNLVEAQRLIKDRRDEIKGELDG